MTYLVDAFTITVIVVLAWAFLKEDAKRLHRHRAASRATLIGSLEGW